MSRRRVRWGGAGVAAAALAGAPFAIIAAADDSLPPELRAIAGAAAWRDSLESYRVPALPPPSDTESAIVLLQGAPLSVEDPAARDELRARLAAQHREVEAALAGLGATVNFRYRLLLNGLAIRAPAGRLDAIARLPQVEAVIPVTYLAPAEAADAPLPEPVAQPGPERPPLPADRGAARIALIDSGIDATHPWLGGGIGPRRAIVGGADILQGDGDPSATLEPATVEAHGTAMASIVLGSPALADLPPERKPRLLAYRVVAPERVDGRVRPLARSDRILAALERAVDPNGDGRVDDRPDVLLLGLARGFDGGGLDPIARALYNADRIDTTVVVPAGNDGPTFGPAGTVGGVAAASAVLSVAGLGAAQAPRTAELRVEIGPAGGAIGPVPLLGATPGDVAAPIVIVGGADGLATGNDPRELYDAQGVSRVAGRLAVVGRGGGQIADKARNAARAGAVAVAVWDTAGDGSFPGTGGGDDWPIPVIGLGGRQGQALADLLRTRPDTTTRIVAMPVEAADLRIASFSSRGPAADGRLKPDLAASSVDVRVAFPGVAVDGRPLETRLSGTSAAAAVAAGMALRLRIDHPDLRSEDVRSLMVQSGSAMDGARLVDQGAGALGTPSRAKVAIDPPILTWTRPRKTSQVVRFTLRDLTGTGGRYQVLQQRAGQAPTKLGPPVTLAPGVRVGMWLRLPPGTEPIEGRVLVAPLDGEEPVAAAPLYSGPPAPTHPDALGVPEVASRDGLTDVRVRVGLVERRDLTVEVSQLHQVRLWLVQGGGAAPLALSGDKQLGDAPAGEYRYVLSRRLADGRTIPPGRYRVRITAVGADGAQIARESEPFAIG